MEGFGEKSYQKLVNVANEARHTSFVPFITALGIPGIGKEQAKHLNKEFSGNVMMFFRAAYNRKSFCSIDGIGEVLEDNIWKWANDYQMCRKTTSFSYGDIRHIRICESNENGHPQHGITVHQSLTRVGDIWQKK